MKRWIDEPHLEGDEAKAKALLDRVEEPRSMPIARARVWARLDSPRAKDRSLAWVALVGGLAGASAVGLVMVDRASPSSLTLVEAIGVDVDARNASAGIELDDASVVRVSSSGRARLIGAPLGAITLSPSTNVTLIGVEAGRLSPAPAGPVAGGIVSPGRSGSRSGRLSKNPFHSSLAVASSPRKSRSATSSSSCSGGTRRPRPGKARGGWGSRPRRRPEKVSYNRSLELVVKAKDQVLPQREETARSEPRTRMRAWVLGTTIALIALSVGSVFGGAVVTVQVTLGAKP